MPAIDWVAFDLGETLVDETENWGRWADYLHIPHLTFFAALGSTIARRLPHTEVFRMFRDDFDVEVEERNKAAGGLPWLFTDDDLYADALPTLADLRAAGYRLAVIANQPAESVPFVATLPVDVHATSADWGVAKPSAEFFTRMTRELDVRPDRIAYVGDRIDNDVLPARRAGMVAVHIQRGPWGYVQASWPEACEAHIRLNELSALPAALERLRAGIGNT